MTSCICLTKTRQVWHMFKETMFPNLEEIEEKNFYIFHLNKAWITSMCSNGYRVVVNILGETYWQKNLEKTDKIMTEQESPSFNVKMFSYYREAIDVAFYALPVIAILLQIACYKYRYIARSFFYIEMISYSLWAVIPMYPPVPFTA